MNTPIINIQNITPRGNLLLLEIIEQPTETDHGFIVPEKEDQTPMVARVIKVGSSAGIPVGSTVMFRRYSVDEVKYKDEQGEKKFHLIEEEFVLAVID